MKIASELPLLEMDLESDYECFVWCGVVAMTTTNQQTQAFFQARFEEIGENLDELSIARGKKLILQIIDTFYGD